MVIAQGEFDHTALALLRVLLAALPVSLLLILVLLVLLVGTAALATLLILASALAALLATLLTALTLLLLILVICHGEYSYVDGMPTGQNFFSSRNHKDFYGVAARSAVMARAVGSKGVHTEEQVPRRKKDPKTAPRRTRGVPMKRIARKELFSSRGFCGRGVQDLLGCPLILSTARKT